MLYQGPLARIEFVDMNERVIPELTRWYDSDYEAGKAFQKLERDDENEKEARSFVTCRQPAIEWENVREFSVFYQDGTFDHAYVY